MFCAVRNGNPDKVSTLIPHLSKAILEHTNDMGRTVLHIAARCQNMGIVKILLSYMSMECVSKSGFHCGTALHILLGNGTYTYNPLVLPMLQKMSTFSFDVQDVNCMTVLDNLVKQPNIYRNEIGFLETKMSLDTICRVYLRQKHESFRNQATKLLVQSCSCLAHFLHEDVLAIVYAYITGHCTRKRIHAN